MRTNYFSRILLTGALLLSSVALYRATAQCGVNAGSDVTIYYGYAPMACATITAATTGMSPFTYSWSSGDTVASITACDATTTTYIISITDSAAVQLLIQ